MANTSKIEKAENETKGKTEHKARFDFESANSIDEMIEGVKNLDSCFQQQELAFVYWKIVSEFWTKGENREKVITFGKTALEILLSDEHNHHASTVFAAYVLNFMGFASFKLERYDESIGYLNRANAILCELELECDCVLKTLAGTHLELHRVKSGMGRKEEAVVHLVKVLSIEEKTMDEGCVELGDANWNVCQGYLKCLNFKAALPFGLKALEICRKHFEDNSVEIAERRRMLGVVYSELGETDKALELNQSSLSVLKDAGYPSDKVMEAEIERSYMLINNGKYEEAIKGLKAVVSNSETEEAYRGRALISMARASYYMNKFEKARKYMKIAHEILDKKDINQFIAAVGFADMSGLYEMMGDFETALSLLRRVLTMPALHQKILVDVSMRLFSLFSLAGEEKEGIRYLEDVVEKLKAILGPEDSQVGSCYLNLGIFCWNAHSLFRAKMYFTLAKGVMDVSLGPNHLNSLKTSQKLSVAYSSIGRYDEAIAIQEQVVQGFRGLVPSEPELLDEAIRMLDEMKLMKNSWCSIL